MRKLFLSLIALLPLAAFGQGYIRGPLTTNTPTAGTNLILNIVSGVAGGTSIAQVNAIIDTNLYSFANGKPIRAVRLGIIFTGDSFTDEYLATSASVWPLMLTNYPAYAGAKRFNMALGGTGWIWTTNAWVNNHTNVYGGGVSNIVSSGLQWITNNMLPGDDLIFTGTVPGVNDMSVTSQMLTNNLTPSLMVSNFVFGIKQVCTALGINLYWIPCTVMNNPTAGFSYNETDPSAYSRYKFLLNNWYRQNTNLVSGVADFVGILPNCLNTNFWSSVDAMHPLIIGQKMMADEWDRAVRRGGSHYPVTSSYRENTNLMFRSDSGTLLDLIHDTTAYPGLHDNVWAVRGGASIVMPDSIATAGFFASSHVDVPALIAQGSSGQTTSAFSVRDSGGGSAFRVYPDGHFFASAASQIAGGLEVYLGSPVYVRINNITGKPYHLLGSDDGSFSIFDASASLKRLTVESDGQVTIPGRVVSTIGFASSSSNKLTAATITIGASPFSWTNTLTKNVNVFVDGVSVTGTVGISGGTIFNTIGQCTVPLQPGEWTTITYTIGTPTATWKPF